MLRKTPMLFAGVFLATVACSGVDSVGNGIDATDITASAYRLSSGQTIHVSPENATVAVGATVKLSTIVRSSTGQTINASGNLAAKWMSSDTTIARVSNSGNVVGVRNGVATITATASGETSAARVTVGTGSSEPSTTTPTTSTTTTPTTSTTTPTTSTTTTPTTSTTTTEPVTGTSTTSSTTTTTTTTTAPTTVSSSSTGTGLSGKGFLSDDFTRYASTTDLFNNISSVAGGGGVWGQALYWDGHNANLVELDRSVLYNGHPTMKYNQPGGTAATPELWVNFANGKTISTLWLRAKIRFSPGFTTTGTLTNSANAYKLLGWGWPSGMSGRGSVEITNTTQYQLYYYSANGGTTTMNFNDITAGNIANEWSDGGWYDYIIEYRVLSPTTAVSRVWISKDGQTPVLRATNNNTAVSGYTVPNVGSVMLGLNFNQVRAANQMQAVWYGQWEVVDGSQDPNPFGLSVY